MMGLLTLAGAALLKAVLPTIATVISGYVVKLLHVQLKRAKIELTTQQEQQVSDLVEHAVLAVEERARREPNLSGAQKTAAATAIVAAGAPELSPPIIKQLIDAALQRVVRPKQIAAVTQPPSLVDAARTMLDRK